MVERAKTKMQSVRKWMSTLETELVILLPGNIVVPNRHLQDDVRELAKYINQIPKYKG